MFKQSSTFPIVRMKSTKLYVVRVPDVVWVSEDNVDPGEEDKCPSSVLCRRSGAGHLYGVDWVTLADHAHWGGVCHRTRKESMKLNDTN